MPQETIDPRRTLACLSACAGISTKALELDAVAKLVSAARLAVAEMRASGMGCPNPWCDCGACRLERAVMIIGIRTRRSA